MAFDGIVTKKIVNEFKNELIGGKIDKIFQNDKNTILLKIYSHSTHYSLNICIDAHNCRIHLTNNTKQNPLVAPNFCMLLRKHLIGGFITNIETYGLERLVKIDINTINEFNEVENKTLIIELMGKHSNVILLNNKNIIIDALRHITASDTIYRDILPSRLYRFPISDKLDFTKINNFDVFYQKIEPSLDNEIYLDNSNNHKVLNIEKLASIIANSFTGFSLSFVKSAIEKCNIQNTNKENLQKLYNYFNNTLSLNNLTFENLYKKDKLYDYVLTCSDKVTLYEQKYKLNNFIDDFYFKRETSETFTNYRNSILKMILDLLKKYNSRLISINSKLKECDEMDKFKLYGELITANLYKLTNTHTDYIELENYYDNNNLIKIPLDKKYSPSLNAKRYFKKYSKLKNALEIVSAQKKETEEELDYIQSIVYELESATTLEDIQDIFEEISENVIFKNDLKFTEKSNNKNTKNQNSLKNSKVFKSSHQKSMANKKSTKKNQKENSYSPLHFEVDGFDLYVGRNNKENDWLTFTFANKSDIWFHTKDVHGSHVILKCGDVEVSDDTLVKCAKITAEHSKAKNSSNVPVDYCKVKFVRKPNGAKPGMVIFTNNKTIYVNPSST